MKKFLVILLFVIGCGGGGGGSQSQNTDKIADWQNREQLCGKIETTCSSSVTFHDALTKTIQQLPQIKYDPQANEPAWQTSCETITNPIGDCDNFAILYYRVIMDSCLPEMFDIDVRIRVVSKEKFHHMFVIIYHGLDVFEVDVNAIINVESNYNVVYEFDDHTIF